MDGFCYTGGFGYGLRCFPAYGPNAASFPLVYDQSVSIEQQIAYIMGAINELTETQGSWATLEDLASLKLWVEGDQTAQTSALEQYADKGDATTLEAAKQLIAQMGRSQLVWDVTQGRFTDSVTAMRNMYTWLSVHAITAEELASSVGTVADLANQSLNVRGLATWSMELKENWTEPEGIRWKENEND